MMPGELSARVTLSGLGILATLTVAAGWTAGFEGAAGVAGGGSVALLNFRWLAKSAAGTAALAREGRPRGVALAGIWLRHVTAFSALALLLASGWAHPLAVIVGLSILPPILLVQGLRAARRPD